MQYRAAGSLNTLASSGAISPSRASAKLREIEADFEILPNDEAESLPRSTCSIRRLPWAAKLALIFLVVLIVTGGALLVFSLSPKKSDDKNKPQNRVVINTWWPGPTDATFDALAGHMSALDSAIAGAINAEVNMYDHTVGPDGSPDTNGETTLDALIVRAARMCFRSCGGKAPR